MARSMYVHVREGKAHSNQSKEQDILKMVSQSEPGSLVFNSSEMHGGHVAYLLSGIAYGKVILLYNKFSGTLICNYAVSSTPVVKYVPVIFWYKIYINLWNR